MSEEEKEQWLYEEYQYTSNFDFSRLDKYEEANDDLCIDDLILDYTMLYEHHKKEIERLKNINEEHRILNGELRKELQQKENIIKEAKEYIELIKTLAMVDKINIFSISKFKEILDKGKE